MTDELLIGLVEQYAVLYNTSLPQYRDHSVRNNAWEDIAEQMNSNAEEVKTRWGKLRNCFTNALKRRRKKSSQAATNIVQWKFEKQMEFLLPYVEVKQTATNLSDTNEDDSVQDFVLQFSEESPISPPIREPSPQPSTSSPSAVRPRTLKRIKTHDSDDDPLREMIDVMKSQDSRQKKVTTDMDENDYFFLAMSKQLKKLPRRDQAEIKFQLHKLIHESEMKMLNQRERIVIISNQTTHDLENIQNISTNHTLSQTVKEEKYC